MLLLKRDLGEISLYVKLYVHSQSSIDRSNNTCVSAAALQGLATSHGSSSGPSLAGPAGLQRGEVGGVSQCFGSWVMLSCFCGL